MSDDTYSADDTATNSRLEGDSRPWSGSTTRREELFDLLANRRRRLVLEHVVTSDEEVFELESLCTQILDQERHEHREPPPDLERRLQTTLHHVHLPRLSDAGVVEYDPRSNTVRYQEDATLERRLEDLADLP